MNRLAIFVFYDKDGIVDNYVSYMLESLKAHLTNLVIVCNGTINEQGKRVLRQFTDRIYQRENSGYDAMAFKLAMTQYCGWEEILQYDEILLLNDTFYGPIYPWQEVFDAMDEKEVDFWGLTYGTESLDYYSNYEKKVPAYIQSYFYAFRSTVLRHLKFQEYWNSFDSTNWIFSDVTNRHEKMFTQFLKELGFSWDTYVRAQLYESMNPRNNFVQYYYVAYQLIKDYRCPVIKRKHFIMKHLTDNPGERGDDIVKALNFIETSTEYDCNLIWDNLLRLYSMHDIATTLNLNYVLPPKNKNTTASGKSVVILWISFKNSLKRCVDYINRLDKTQPVYVYSETEEIIKSVQEQTQNRNIYWKYVSTENIYSYVLSKCRELALDNEYVVFLHDIDYLKCGSFELQQYNLMEHMWSNLLDGQSHLSGIEDLFREHERLGMVIVPQPLFGDFFSGIGEKRNCFLAFACRSDAILKACQFSEAHGVEARKENWGSEWEYKAAEDLSLKLQYMGYYTATVMNADYAATAYSQMEALLGRILQQAKHKFAFADFDSYLDGEMITYARQFSALLVYGAGECGYRTANLLINNGIKFTGFLVSDGQFYEKEKYGYPVFALSEVRNLPEFGIVVAVANPKAQRDIEANLTKFNCTDIFFL